ncbi:hypothetical protein BDN72DRAFT_964029 [Pluteus cervinus]|uniref:Uncharacterized protein n=1 Tax=Pluteus cervinus TaxID=181527 RepID=A0ACD3AC68_9AGAR|nr:hypothetical protein BDN72DRAFT_964029 [Pluteus cervinus]
MVANRKAQIVPAPPNSRSTSSQSLPKPSTNGKAKLQAVSAGKKHQPEKLQHQLSNGSHDSSSKKKHQRKQPAPKSRTIWSSLFSVVLLLLCFHAFTTCPHDQSLSYPVCRTLSVYRRTIVEPYILPPLSSAFHSPAVKPYVQAVQQYVPHIQRAERQLRPYTQRAGTFLNAASAHAYKSYLLPTHKAYILPNYNAYLRPYVAQASPYVSKLTTTVHDTWNTVQPHLKNAYSRIHPYVLKAWEVVRPQLYTLLRHLQVQFTNLAKQLGELRKEFVDPHVRRIWEKVAESSIHASSPTPTSSVAPTSEASYPPEVTITEIVAEVVATPLLSVEQPQIPVPKPTPDATPEESISVDASTSETPVPVPEELPITEIQREEAKQSAASIAEASAGTVQSGPIQSLVEELVGTPSEVVPEPTPNAETEEPEEIDDFLRELGVDEEGSGSSEEVEEEEDPAPSEHQPESEEEKKARVAARRADIVGRHIKWQEKIDKVIEEYTPAFRTFLAQHRWGAVSELESREGGRAMLEVDEETTQEREAAGVEIKPPQKGKGWINGDKGLHDEGERLIRGLDGYLKKVARKISYAAEEKVESLKVEERVKWADVVTKVETRFVDKLNQVQADVHSWYMGLRDDEIQKMLALEEELKAVAQSAQADLGMDYAWLDDVTYRDWQDYHFLMTSAHNFAHEIRGIQNGTHADPASDPLPPALDTLQQDMEDVINGFNAAVLQSKAEAQQLIGEEPQPEEELSEPIDEEVNILPVDPQEEEVDEGLKEAAKIVIGRGKEEVEEALKRASAANAGREEL